MLLLVSLPFFAFACCHFRPLVPFGIVHLPAAVLVRGVSPVGGRMAEGRRKLRQRLDRQNTRALVLLPLSPAFFSSPRSFYWLAALRGPQPYRASVASQLPLLAACIVAARLAKAASLLAATLTFSSSVSTRGGVGFGLVSVGHWSAT